ncbi:MAG: c-type cytochrome [Candidatus Xenobia bacterium]
MNWKAFFGGVLAVLVLGVLVAAAVVKFGMFPTNADASPGWVERRLANLERDAWTGNHEPKDAQMPAVSDANLMDGVKLYKANCMGCHGGPDDTHKGFGRAFYPPAPNFTARPFDMEEPEFQYTVTHGVRLTGMPSFGKFLKPEEMGKINLALHHLKDLPAAVNAEWQKP